jgi:hypothetical protein
MTIFDYTYDFTDNLIFLPTWFHKQIYEQKHSTDTLFSLWLTRCL